MDATKPMETKVHTDDVVADGTTTYQHVEVDNDRTAAGKAVEEADLPSGYFYNPRFIGTYIAIGLGVCGGDGTFALLAPLLGVINAEIGPDANIIWVSLAYTLGLAVCLTLVGRLSDIFGRRWFFIGGSVIALLGTIVCAVAQNVPTLIGGMVLVGIAAGAQMSFFWVLSELVPMRHRFIWNSGIYAIAIPFVALGPKVSQSFQTNTSVGWRGTLYTMIGINGLSTILWFCFYHPPTFRMLHQSRSRMQIIREFDFMGLFLFTAGLLLFLMGLSWGGSVYPWKSAHVISTVTVGVLILIGFFAWEGLVDHKDPFIPLHLFREMKFVAVVIIVTVYAMVYYAFSVIWPSMVAILYDDVSPATAGWLNCIVGALLIGGEIIGNVLADYIAPRTLFIVCSICGAALLSAVGADPRNRQLSEGLLIVGMTFIGVCEGVGLTMCTVSIKNQEEIGTAGGVSGSVRSAGSTLGGVVYNTVLANRLANTIPALVIPAAVSSGLPRASVPKLLSALQGLIPTSAVPGLTKEALAAASDAFKTANAQAYRTVFFTTLAFSLIGVIVSFFTGEPEKSLSHYVGARLHGGKAVLENPSENEEKEA